MTTKSKTEPNGANLTSLADIMQAPTANSLIMSQRFALEAARFWARRMHAYADQMETLANCTSTGDVATAQTQFLERMREDWAAESEAFGALMTPAEAPAPARRHRGNGGEAQA
jgi:hypothetical protein